MVGHALSGTDAEPPLGTGREDTPPRHTAVLFSAQATLPSALTVLGPHMVQVVTIMDYTGAYVEEGFFVPADYGEIVAMVWLPDQRCGSLAKTAPHDRPRTRGAVHACAY